MSDSEIERSGDLDPAEILAANHINDVEILADLNDVELEAIGIPIGARKKIRRALARLGYEVEDTQALSPQPAADEFAQQVEPLPVVEQAAAATP